MIFWYNLVYLISNMTHFFILFRMRRKMACFELCISFALTENEDFWNFHGSLTLNKGKLLRYSGRLWHSIVSNMTHFYHNALFSGLKVKVLFQQNILLANFLPAEYSDEYPAGWYLVRENSSRRMQR